MRFREYVSKLDFDEDWPRVDGKRDEETIQLMKGDGYRFEQILSAILTSKEPLKILDVGTTPFTFFIKESYPHYEVSSLDLTTLAEELCRKRGIKFRVHDLAKQPLLFDSDYFDVVIFTEVLEHLLTPPTRVMKEIYRILAPKGKLIFTVPNFAALGKRLGLLFGVSPLINPDEQMQEGWVHGYGHPREYTMHECLSIMNASGFRVDRKKFLHPQPSLVKETGRRRYLRALLLYPFYLLIPSIRAKIYLECSKAG